MKKVFVFCITLILLCLFLPTAPVFADEGFEYVENPTGVTVTSLPAPENGILVVPAKLGGKPVTDISALAIRDRLLITELRLPDSLTEISAVAFSDCKNLKKVVFGKGLKVIKAYAFSDCAALESVTLPESVETIGSGAFKGCVSLKKVSIGHIKTLKDATFKECTALKEISFSSVEKMESKVFSGCTSLESIAFPEGLSEIGEYSFEGCTSLKSITLPDSLTVLPYGLFAECSSLSEIELGKNVTESDTTAINGTAYFENPNNRIDGVLYLGNFIISADIPLPSDVTIKEGVTYIPNNVFTKTYGMNTLTLPDSVRKIEIGAFDDCAGLHTVNFGDGITEIGASAFDDTAFYNYSGPWEDGFLYAGNYLLGVSSEVVGEVAVKDGTRVIAAYAFYRCKDITKITLPDSIIGLGLAAFRECDGITEITLPAKIAKVDKYAFSNCSSLKTITVMGKYTEFDPAWCQLFNNWDGDGDDKIYIEKICGGAGSPAEAAAKDLGITFKAIEVPDIPKSEDPKADQAGGENGANIYLYAGVGVGLLAIAAGIIIFLRKKKEAAE